MLGFDEPMAHTRDAMWAPDVAAEAIELVENVPEYHVELGTILIRNPRRRDDAEDHQHGRAPPGAGVDPCPPEPRHRGQ